MSHEVWITVSVLIIVLVMLVFTRRSPDVIIWGGVGLLLLAPLPGDGGTWRIGVLTAHDALAGLANEGVVTIAVLFIVVAGLTKTGGMNWLAQRLLGRPQSLAAAQARLMVPAAAMSAFLNNTPLVAMLLPVVGDWGRSIRQSPSKLLMPLSFASILGGACTLIGTSTNLIVNGWLIEYQTASDPSVAHPGLGMFEVAVVGVPITLIGIGFVLLTTRWLLPDRKPVLGATHDAREYTVEMIVEAGPLVDQTIERAGLRHLPGLYLVEIERQQQVLPAVSPHVVLREGDHLVFAGVVKSVVDLQKIRGLRPATNQVYKLDEPRTNRVLVEAVVSDSCPLVGQTIRQGRFRTTYNAAVIAVARNGTRIADCKIGDIRLQAGDTLLLETRSSFAEQQRNSRDFYLVSAIAGSNLVDHERAWIALAILAGLVTLVSLEWMTMLQASVLAAGLTIVTGCTTARAARQAIDWQVLLVLAGALALGKAMETSGLAPIIGEALHMLVGEDPYGMLAAVFIITAVLASLITAKAAAVLMLPIAAAAAADLNVAILPMVIAIMIASATTLATPIGYPTNMMVYGPGGYRFTDYLRLGGTLTVLTAAFSVWLIPLVWRFHP